MRLTALILIPALLSAAACAPVSSRVPTPDGNLFSVPVRTLADLKFKQIERQTHDLSCGAAALATVLTHFYGHDVSEREIIEVMLEIGDREKILKEGFSLLELKQFAEKKGYVSQGFRIDDARMLGKLKVPVITLTAVRGYAHFVVVRGIDGGRIFLADPAFGNRSRPLDSFAKDWNRVILVVVSPSREPNDEFTLEEQLKAPAKEIMLLHDRALLSVAPRIGEF